MAGPIKPSEIQAKKNEDIPEAVYAAFNKLIIKYWNGHRAIVPKQEVLNEIYRSTLLTEEEVYARHLLDVEPAYIEAGWSVEYDSPSLGESYESFFIFRKKAKVSRNDL